MKPSISIYLLNVVTALVFDSLNMLIHVTVVTVAQEVITCMFPNGRDPIVAQFELKGPTQAAQLRAA